MELKDIKKRKYQGYVWMSDQKKPLTLKGDKDFDFSETKYQTVNPFVIEALLWCENTKTSVHVRHTGRYVINEFVLTDDDLKNEKFYIPHRLETSGRKARFCQIWEEKDDDLCEGFPVFTLKAIVFTGFANPSKQA
jgi:CRISPR type III-associated protein (TIGR04423 family)